MLVSNTDTTTSLSRRTSVTAFLTASSNSSSLFNTCSHTGTNTSTVKKRGKNLKTKAWRGKETEADQTTFMLVIRELTTRVSRVSISVRENLEKRWKDMLWWWELLAQHSGAGDPLCHWSSFILMTTICYMSNLLNLQRNYIMQHAWCINGCIVPQVHDLLPSCQFVWLKFASNSCVPEKLGHLLRVKLNGFGTA